MNRSQRDFQAALFSLPCPGGNGYHPRLLGVANVGIRAGIPSPDVAAAIRANTLPGGRRVPDREISQAVEKATRDCGTGKVWHCPRSITRPVLHPAKLLLGVLAHGEGATEADLWELSPVRLDWDSERDAPELLRLLYSPDDRLFIGTRYDAGDEHVRTVVDWRTRFEDGEPVPEHFIPNPLTGELGKTKDGNPSFRADSCVARFRFAVLEFDTVPEPLRERGQSADAWPRESQCQFWAGALAFKWPIAAIVDSGGKSIHAWLTVDAIDTADWEAKVEGEIFAHFLVPCGVDSSCKNESRLSRMPGHYRAEKSRWQKIIYLNPDAGKENP